jgi:hypothetical protein
VSTFEIDQEISFELFPNPSADVIYLTSDATENLTLAIVDLKGRTISIQDLNIPIQKTMINLDHLAAAQYFLQISNASGNLVSIITIQKMNK